MKAQIMLKWNSVAFIHGMDNEFNVAKEMAAL
jgi:hypothetical protein